MVGVHVQNLETIEEAIRRFKRECDRDGLMQEIKRRRFFESPIVKRKRKAQEVQKRRKRQRRFNRF